MFKRKLLLGLILFTYIGATLGQSAVIRGRVNGVEGSYGGYDLLSPTTDASGGGQSLPILGYNYLWQGTGWDRQRTPFVFKSLNAVLITAESTIWTPAAGKKFRLMGYCLAQGVVTGAILLKDNTAGTTIMIIPQQTIGVAFCSNPMGNGILSATINNVLTATGAATETITGYVFGTEE